MTVNEATNKVNNTHEQLQQIARALAKQHTEDLDKVIDSVNNVKELTDSQIKNLIVLLSLKTYSFSEVEELSELRAECAETLRKEAYNQALLTAEGTAGVKDAIATSACAGEKAAELVYNCVAGILKNKRDEAHRLVAALQAVLFARTQEAKISAYNTQEKAAYEDKF